MKQNKNNIPEGWQKVTLRQCVDIDRNSLSEKTADNKEFFYIDLSAVSAGVITFPKEKVSFRNAPSRARRIIHKGDIIFSTVRPYLKGFALIDFDSDDYIVSTGFSVLTAKNNFSSKYIYHYLFSENFQKQIFISLLGSSFPALNSKDVKSLSILIPISITEQQKIVEVLETWDKAIQLTRKLIEQKELQKKYLMQQLLSHKHIQNSDRKDSFYRINEFLNEENNKTTLNNQYPVLSVTKKGVCLQSEYFDKQIASEDNIGYKILTKKKIVFSPMNLWMGAIGFSEQQTGIVSPAYKIFSVNERIALFDFLKYYMKTPRMLYLYSINSEIGASIVRRNLDLNGLLHSKILLPHIEKQKKFSDILLLADKEIDLLRQKLAKLEEQKKGLMQVLLTGKVRLAVKEIK